MPRCFYVGKGLQKRPSSAKNRNHKWHAIVKRFGLRVEVCIGPVTHEEACAWEIENIALMGSFSTNHSHNDPVDVGCNFTKGGEGTVGRPAPNRGKSPSDATRIKMVLSHLGKPNPKVGDAHRGRKRPQEWKDSLSAGMAPVLSQIGESQRKRHELRRTSGLRNTCTACHTPGHNKRTCEVVKGTYNRESTLEKGPEVLDDGKKTPEAPDGGN